MRLFFFQKQWQVNDQQLQNLIPSMYTARFEDMWNYGKNVIFDFLVIIHFFSNICLHVLIMLLIWWF